MITLLETRVTIKMTAEEADSLCKFFDELPSKMYFPANTRMQQTAIELYEVLKNFRGQP